AGVGAARPPPPAAPPSISGIAGDSTSSQGPPRRPCHETNRFVRYRARETCNETNGLFRYRASIVLGTRPFRKDRRLLADAVELLAVAEEEVAAGEDRGGARAVLELVLRHELRLFGRLEDE